MWSPVRRSEPPWGRDGSFGITVRVTATFEEAPEAGEISTSPRKETLHEQLYYELTPAECMEGKQECADRINNVFKGDAQIEINPRIVSVEVTSEATSNERIDGVTPNAQSIRVDKLPRQSIKRLIVSGIEDRQDESRAQDEEVEEDIEEEVGAEEAESEAEEETEEEEETLTPNRRKKVTRKIVKTQVKLNGFAPAVTRRSTLSVHGTSIAGTVTRSATRDTLARNVRRSLNLTHS